MQALSIMYHDVVDAGDFASSGFAGEGAHMYKLERDNFARHLEEIRRAAQTTVAVLGTKAAGRLLYLTFDDGGASAFTHIAPMLEEQGWRGHFFITTDRIGTPGFVTAEQIRELDRRGHVIGSHSCSHPTRMAACTREQLDHEWRESARVLAEILGRPMTLGSVPGGFYSREVGAAAARAGIRDLFTSEPTARSWVVDGCRVYGRYAIVRGMPAACSGDLAAGKLAARWKQTAWWELKKVAKAASGSNYLRVREFLISRGRR